MAKRKAKKPVVSRPAKPVVNDQSDFLYWVCYPVDLTLSSGGVDDALDEFRATSFSTLEESLPLLTELQEKGAPFFCVFGRQVKVESSRSVRVTAGKTSINIPVPPQGKVSDGQESSEEDDSEEEREVGQEAGEGEEPQGPRGGVGDSD